MKYAHICQKDTSDPAEHCQRQRLPVANFLETNLNIGSFSERFSSAGEICYSADQTIRHTNEKTHLPQRQIEALHIITL